MKKRTLTIVGVLAALAVMSVFVFFIFFKEDNNTTLTIAEKQWIEKNKNNVIDLDILNNVSILNNDGEGVFFDFITDLEDDTKLTFNKVSYTNTSNSNYALERKKDIGKNDILIYKDEYVLVGKDRVKYISLSELDGLTIGVLENELEDANSYLRANVSFKSYANLDDLIAKLVDQDAELDAIVMTKLDYLKHFDEENKLYIYYNITEMNDNYVLSLGNEEKLNVIFKKYAEKWMAESYDESFNRHFTKNYFTIHGVEEQAQVKFRSKRYVYGYVENLPYDTLINDTHYGINSVFISKFASLGDIEIVYQKYDNYEKMVKDFEENKIDFYYDSYKEKEYNLDVFKTISPFKEDIVIISNLGNNITVNSIRSLKNKEVLTLSNSAIEKYLTDNKITVKSFKTLEDLISKINEDSIVALNYANYNYYVRKDLTKFKIDYQFELDTDYKYVIRDIKNNELFENYFDFFLEFSNTKALVNDGYDALLNVSTNTLMIKLIISSVGALIVLLVAIIFYKKIPAKKKALTKEDKLKYVDMLTSLKNRNYLNDNIEKWDESEIYPQAIVIIDLNNIAYINDNYGHAEGDNVIKEAANILITNQIPKSDIIRTNGNEFLIYLVEYDEKQVVSYIRKINKEFKELSHGFGAAVGYSMITDAIKTIDDAVNEATLDMKNNKDELNN